MWPAALITAGAVAFGRLFVTGILPSAVLTTALWLVLRADAFARTTGGLRIGDVIPPDFGPNQGGSILLFLLGVVLLTAVLEGFHLAVVRLLEGYWGASRIALTLSAPGLSRHRNRQRKALSEWTRLRPTTQPEPTEADGTLRLNEQAAARREAHRDRLRLVRARLVIDEYPPKEADLLPTRLGNALRSGERRAGERYGWSTVHAWPRLYLGLPEQIVTAYRYSRDAMDAAAIFCLTFLAVSVLTTVAFIDDPALLWVPPMFLVLSYVSYRSAVASALTHGVILQAAFDRNRFDLFESMHQPMPNTPLEEYRKAKEISMFLTDGIDPETAIRTLPEPYSHAEPERKRWLRWRRRGKHSIALDHDRAEGTTGSQP